VSQGRQVLICPSCQSAGMDALGLDRCAQCGSLALVRRLGETTCRDCGAAETGDPAGSDAVAGLAQEVDAALRRTLGRPGS
jgi:hypothetical protein